MNLLYEFTKPLLAWFATYGRHHLPWKKFHTAYAIWVSEIMLQQTQVQTVIPYFNRFITRFPTVRELATAAEDEVFSYWAGLGYYSRARNLHKTAQIVHYQWGDAFPNKVEELLQLPGIGASTAAAIASLAFHQPTAILDANVKRILSRYFKLEGPLDSPASQKKLWHLAQWCMSCEHCADYTQAIMDLGALCCTVKKPDCLHCPVHKTCLAYQEGVVELYPPKKIKKTKPTQAKQFLLLHKGDAIYLEKNPPKGIWGSLWSLPNIEYHTTAGEFIEQEYGLRTEQIRELMILKHSFTHFHLQMKALSIKINEASSTTSLVGSWVSKQEISNLGIAKPILTIIQHFYSNK